MWPFKPKTEKRNSDYTQSIIQSFEDQEFDLGGSNAVLKIAALEVAAGLWRRAFSSAIVEPVNRRTKSISPQFLGWVAEGLIREGEALALIEADSNGIHLQPAADFDAVQGGIRESQWRYRVSTFGPARTKTITSVPSAGVVHFRWSLDARSPEHGLAPWQRASTTSGLAANLEQRLAEEMSAVTGFLLPIPSDPGGVDVDGALLDTYQNLKAELKKLRGKTSLVETVGQGYGEGQQSAVKSDWQPVRLGASPPVELINLRDKAAMSLLQACGIPRGLIDESDGSSKRESYRAFLHSSVSPVAATVEHELSEKLEIAVKLDFSGLFAADIASKARAASGLVRVGYSQDEAAKMSGLV